MRSRLVRAATWVIIVLGAVRLFALVLHEPMLGYANNYDFIRISSWFDLWPAPHSTPPGFNPLAQHLEAPISRYRVQPEIEGGKYYLTSDLLLVGFALAISEFLDAGRSEPGRHFDLRVLGVLRACLLLVAAALVTGFYQEQSPTAGLGSALLFSLVLADPAFSLLFNTLYSEYIGVLLAYSGGALTAYALAFGPLRGWSSAGFGIVLMLLAVSKVQFIGLPGLFICLLSLGVGGERGWSRTWAVASLGAVIGVVVQLRTMDRGDYMWSARMAYATDTYLGTVLPNLREPKRGLELLGLPERCEQHIGKTWYDPGMQPAPCPEVLGVPRVRLIGIFIEEPGVIARIVRRALPLWAPALLDHFGQVEGEHFGHVDRRFPAGFWSFADAVTSLPIGLFAASLGLGVIGGGLAFVLLVVRRFSAPSGYFSPLLPSVVLVLAATETYSFGSALLGDGFVDLPRHSLLGQMCMPPLCLGSILLLWRQGFSRDRWSRPGAAK